MTYGCTVVINFICTVWVSAFSAMSHSEPATARGPVPWAMPGEMTPGRVPLLERATQYAEDVSDIALQRRTPESARQLVEALWRDWGDPIVNYDYQDILISFIADLDFVLPKNAPEADAFRRALRDGLAEFYYSGGMNNPEIPLVARNFADALMQVSGPDDLETTAIIATVALSVAESRRQITVDPNEVVALSERLGLTPETFARLMQADQDAFRKRLHSFLGETDVHAPIERALTAETDEMIFAARDAVAQLEWHDAAPLTAESASPSVSSQPVSAPSARQRFRDWFEDLRRVTRNADPPRAELERLARAVAEGFGDPEIDRQAGRALLIAYRRILESRSPRPKAEIVRAIDEDLVRIGRSAVTDDRMRRLWAQAVYALGQRASPRVLETIDLRITREEDRKTRSLLEAAKSRIGRASGHAPKP